MIGLERRVLLRHYLDQGWSKTALAEQLGFTRQTIHRWLATGELDRDLDAAAVRYRARPPVPTKLDPYKPIVTSRLEAYPELSAVRLFDEVRAAGYAGSLTQLKVFVRQARPRPEPEPLVRVETPPGHQAQVDFAEFSFPWGKRFALMVVLGYSRLLWLRFYPRQTMLVLMRGLEDALAFIGGVPRELLFDQLKAVIIEDRRPEGGRVLENPTFLRFAHHWGFSIRACRPYRAKTKGKVERPVRYVRDNFVYARAFLGDDDLDAQRLRWLTEVANVRIHQTTLEQPWVRFERDERAMLQPTAERAFPALGLIPPRTESTTSRRAPRSRLVVERRPLAAYAELAAAAAGGA